MSDVLSKLRRGGFRKVGFIGVGKSNLSLLSLLPLGNTEVVLRSETELDKSRIPNGINLKAVRCGESAFSGIDEDLIICSPSVRRDRAELSAALARGTRFSSDAELFFENCTGDVFAVTGSDGKSTTTALLARIMSMRHRASLIGNIGVPMLESLSEGVQLYCAELSSFMLSYLNVRVRRAAITNITPNHLNWHKDFSEYKETKLSLIRSADEAVLSADDRVLSEYLESNGAFAVTSTDSSFEELKKHYNCNLYFTYNGEYILKNGEKLIAAVDIKRKEKHNLKNMLTAIALADGYYDIDGLSEVARSFSGLEHRAELFLSLGGIDFINSSIDTTPARTKSTLESLGRRVVLLLCGRGKGLSYEPLTEPVSRYASHVVITGEDKAKMHAMLCKHADCVTASSFDSAVKLAARLATVGEAVLLSPAATSFDEFSSFEERGEKFKKIAAETFSEEIRKEV